MECLELLIEQESSENRLEGFLVFYSISTPPPMKPSEPMGISFGSISNYADSLNKQFGIPSPSIKPKTPSSIVTAETFNSQEINQALSNPYISSINGKDLAYANSLAQQFNAPSPVIRPITPSPVITAQTFNPHLVIESVNNPICPSLPNKPLIVPSSYAKPEIGIPSYEPKFNLHPQNFKSFDPIKIEPKIPEILNPGKKYFDDFRKFHTIKFSGLKNKEPVYDLFKKNEFTMVYNQVSKGLRLEKDAVRAITFTNPLKNEDDLSPSFTSGIRELRFPAIKPQKIAFDLLSQKDYNQIINNASLPHELGHAKIDKKYSKFYPEVNIHKSELSGFNEHLADAMSFDSLKNTPQFFKTKTERINFEDTWVTKPNNHPMSEAEKDYCESIAFKEDVSFIPGKQATINMLGDDLLKQKYDLTLRNVLDTKYGNDSYKETVYNNINKLTNFYQKSAIKLVDLSKRNYIFSDFKAKKILSRVEKESLRFKEGL